MIVLVSQRLKCFIYHAVILILMVGLASVGFNYGYRFLFDSTINSSFFYIATLVLGFGIVILFRKDYIFISEFKFTPQEIVIRTLFGFSKRFDLQQFSLMPRLHKTINAPFLEEKASLSIAILNRETGRIVREYGWTGFSADDFRGVCRLYGFKDDTDFKLFRADDFASARRHLPIIIGSVLLSGAAIVVLLWLKLQTIAG
ncbi:hypothetical protein [Pseudomonas sp. OV226]|uniref:hypothetical protein n=1 Tax=Pseudomonas sp. OV226 TaxID=2135588 RepID=UPI000D7A8604|nr:hypothetical protein [Pseudomonas sp. OV226]PWK39421.1 hypothetical protein C7534_113119 [Pseudomonas sp. OV226]